MDGEIKAQRICRGLHSSEYQFLSMFFLVMYFTYKTVLICQCELKISLQNFCAYSK